jgi:hypothetical protein
MPTPGFRHSLLPSPPSRCVRIGVTTVDLRHTFSWRDAAPWLPCRNYEPVPIGEKVSYRIPIVPNTYRFKTGHKLRLLLTNDDQGKKKPAIAGLRHGGVGFNCISDILASSQLLIPVLPKTDLKIKDGSVTQPIAATHSANFSAGVDRARSFWGVP